MPHLACPYDILIIRGASGVGKSTLSVCFNRNFKNGIVVEIDNVWKMINYPNWIDDKEYLMALEASWQACGYYLDKGFRPAIFIGVLNLNSLGHLISLIESEKGKQYSYCVISLYCEEDELERRIKGRKNGFNNVSAAQYVNREILSNPTDNEVLVNTTMLSPDEVFKIVMSRL